MTDCPIENGPAGENVLAMVIAGEPGALVTVQAILAPAAVAAVSKLMVPTCKFEVTVPPAPMPVQLTADIENVGFWDSVRVVAVAVFVSIWIGPVTPVPAVAVAMIWLDQPFVPVKMKEPVPPLEILVSVNVGV